MKRAVFITGIAGLLGSNIAYILRDRYRISGMDRNPIRIKGVNNRVGSVLNYDALRSMILQDRPDYLIHCAALVNLDRCEEVPDEAWELNYQLTKFLADLCGEIHCKMIFISSDAVFAGNVAGLNSETTPVAPISVYGKTKAAAEQEVLKNPRGLVVRTNIYGYNFRDKSSFGEWIKNTLESQLELNMFTDLWFSPILVNELTEILAMCMEQDVSGLYHICSTGSISKYDMAVEIQKVFGLLGTINKASMKHFAFKAPRTQNMGMDNTAIRERLGISIDTPEESVVRFKKLWDEGYPKQLKKGGYDE